MTGRGMGIRWNILHNWRFSQLNIVRVQPPVLEFNVNLAQLSNLVDKALYNLYIRVTELGVIEFVERCNVRVHRVNQFFIHGTCVLRLLFCRSL